MFHVRALIWRLADSSRSVDEREEAAFRAVVDLLNDLRAASDHDLYSLVADRPPLSGTRRWDAFVAGVVEQACEDRGRRAPSWIEEPERFIDPPWYLSTDLYFRDLEEQTAPPALRRHGVLVAVVELATV